MLKLSGRIYDHRDFPLLHTSKICVRKPTPHCKPDNG